MPMVRGVPEHECMLELPKRKRQKHVPTTPTAQNSNENATSWQYKGSTEECVHVVQTGMWRHSIGIVKQQTVQAAISTKPRRVVPYIQVIANL